LQFVVLLLVEEVFWSVVGRNESPILVTDTWRSALVELNLVVAMVIC
jgi:hypothetical protein